jgi:hypothetical protein
MDINIRRKEGISQAIKRQLIELGANEAQFKNESLWVSIKEIISDKNAGDKLKTKAGEKDLGEAFEQNTTTNVDDTVSITKETWNKLVTLTGAHKATKEDISMPAQRQTQTPAQEAASSKTNNPSEEGSTPVEGNENASAETGLSPEDREKYRNNNPANGKLDLPYTQGDVADCWILSGIESIKRKAGGKKYLESLITQDPSGNYFTVSLPGIGYKYTFTQQDLKNATHLSIGDLDVRLFELAMDKYYKSKNEGSRDEYGSNIGRDYTEEFYKIIIRPNAFRKITSTPNNPFNPIDFSNPRKAFTISVKSNDTPTVEDGARCGSKMHSRHAYSVIKSDAQYIYIVDPHSSDRIMKLSIEEFKKYNILVESVVLP